MSPLAQALLEQLYRKGGDFLSSAELTAPRMKVWQAVAELRELGIEVEGKRRKGYRLVDSTQVFSTDAFYAHLTTQRLGRHFEWVESIDSTNNAIKAQAHRLPEGATLAAEHQTAGRGRQGRSWSSAQGALQFSLLLKPRIAPSQGALLTQVTGASLAQTLSTLCDLGIKWPNDLLIDGKKVCGILAEMMCDGEEVSWVCVGIGLNVNQTHFDDLPQATSLALACGKKFDRALLLAQILNGLERDYAHFFDQGAEKFLDLCRAKSTLLGHSVTFDGGCGLATDIDSQGRLVVRLDNGTTQALTSGEAHIGIGK